MEHTVGKSWKDVTAAGGVEQLAGDALLEVPVNFLTSTFQFRVRQLSFLNTSIWFGHEFSTEVTISVLVADTY